MALIVAVHGIAQQYKGEHLLEAAWLPALRDGLKRAGGTLEDDRAFAMVFYGDIFRESGKVDLPAYEAEDVTDPWECDLLAAWAEEAARVDASVQSPSGPGKGRTPGFVQRALNALSQSKFFTSVSERALIGNLKQVRQYMHDELVRKEIQRRLLACIGADTRIVIGHSLGSVIAYEVLATPPERGNLERGIKVLLTLGSPLGIRNLIFDRLSPRPEEGTGAWPGSIEHWINIADGGDIVALNKKLASLFGAKVVDHLIHNGATAHDVSRYLTAIETGRALRRGLEG